MKRLGFLLAALLLAARARAQGPDLASPAVRAGLDAIRKEAVGSHVRYLADDLLEGRGTGTRGFDLAAHYVASRFEAMGLEPAGDRGTWFQSLPLRHSDLLHGRCGVTLIRRGEATELRMDRDFVMSPDPARRESDVTADVVYVGYGITAPELGYDDFAHVDARGKIVVTVGGAPSTFPSTLQAHYSNNRIKDANLAAHGAFGVIVVRTPGDQKRAPWQRLVNASRLPGFRWLDEKGAPDGVEPALQGATTLDQLAAEKLFTGSRVPLAKLFEEAEAGHATSFALPLRARLRRATRHSAASSANVVGLLRGSDPRLRDQLVVYSAHLDHLGIGEPVRGDSIHNGAFDNATGIAALLEVANAFALARQRPRRSILFLAVTGEEKGLQGSSYFAAHPSVPGDEIVADLNMDMYVMIGPLRELVAYGAEHSTLLAEAQQAAARLGLKIVPDPAPEEHIFVRSDQYSFVRHGVPSLFLVGSAGAEMRDQVRAWRHDIYHTPKDDLSQPMDFEQLAQFARVNYLTGYLVANRTRRPAWNPGDFFGEHFGPASMRH